MTFIIIAASRTVRVIGPICDSVPCDDGGNSGTRPCVGFSPNRPVKEQGMRTEPAPSVPTARLPMPTASAATPPPDEPPDVRPIFHGLWVAPNSRESVTPFQPYSGEVVLPSSTVPASRRRCATGASTVHGPFSSVARLPMRVGRPLVSTMSLMVIGTPSRSLSRLPPFFQRFSEARAARSAPSGSRCWKALSCGLNASMRAIAAFAASTGEALRAL